MAESRLVGRRSRLPRGQGMLELALILPVLLLILFGVIDFGRLLLMYSAVSNAAREAVRYGVVSGSGAGTPPYLDCTGIRTAAKRTAASGLVGLSDGDITIEYDRDNGAGGTSVFAECDDSPAATSIEFGDRIVVTVSVTFRPITPIAGNYIPPLPVTFSTARTLLKGGVQMATPTPAPTTTAPPTGTPTITPTSTPTSTPTNTPSADCDDITLGPITTNNPSKYARLTITNSTGSQIQISELSVTWPQSPNNKLKEVLFGSQQIYDLEDSSSPTLIPSEYPWKSGTDSYRYLNDGQTKTLETRYDGGAGSTGYVFVVTFTNGCSLQRTK